MRRSNKFSQTNQPTNQASNESKRPIQTHQTKPAEPKQTKFTKTDLLNLTIYNNLVWSSWVGADCLKQVLITSNIARLSNAAQGTLWLSITNPQCYSCKWWLNLRNFLGIANCCSFAKLLPMSLFLSEWSHVSTSALKCTLPLFTLQCKQV